MKNVDNEKLFAELVGSLHDNLIKRDNLANMSLTRTIAGERSTKLEFSDGFELTIDHGPTQQSIFDLCRKPAPTRAEIVAQAKRDVADRFFEGHDGVGEVVECFAGHNKVEFIVDREKRTVVAILRLAYIPSEVVAKGIAKAAPDDVFNADIGKAIALRRALGLTVPTEYTNAPKPEGVRVGDVVRSEVEDRGGKIRKIVSHIVSIDDINAGKTRVGSPVAKESIVIDDTDREEYEDDSD
jgi:hypothetical protein